MTQKSRSAHPAAAVPPARRAAGDPHDELPRLPWRRRVLVVLLAVGTAVTVVLSLLDPPGGVKRHPPPPAAPLPDTARCAPGQTQGCVGGSVQVIVAPPAAPASAAR